MITVLSPAKSLNFDPVYPTVEPKNPPFPEKTGRLVKSLSNMSGPKLKTIMPVSDSLIELNRSRYADFFSQPEKPAIHAFSGDVYVGFEVDSLETEALEFAENHVRILSGLYGLLRPFDVIRPHRLEMGTKWAPRYKKLTDFWKSDIADALRDALDEQGSNTLLNLASQEYWASVAPYTEKLGLDVANVDFRQDGPNGPVFQSFAAKRARGMMARYICENHIDDVASLESFDSDGYEFRGREGNTLRFVRS